MIALRREERLGRRRPLLLGLRADYLIGLGIFGTTLLRWGVGGVVPVDALLVILPFGIRRSSPRTRRMISLMVLPVWMFLLGSTAALLPVGFPSWALISVGTDLLLLACFLGTYSVGLRLSEHDWARLSKWILLSILVLAAELLVLSAGQYRPMGTFANPNYAGHWLAVAALLFLRTNRSAVAKGVAVAAAGLGIVATGSFAAIAMLLVGSAFATLSKVRDQGSHLYWRLLAAVLLALGAVGFYQGFQDFRADQAAEADGAVTAGRFDRSSAGRAHIWTSALRLVPANPLGVGPQGISNRNLIGRGLEVHNDYLALLVERGALGLVGFSLLCIRLWRASPRAGAFRNLMVAAAVGGVFRETLHFRHLWLFAALALALDHLPSRPTGIDVQRSASAV